MAGEATQAFIGLGSNVGDRLGHLCTAWRRISSARDVEVIQASRVYETEAHTLADADAQRPYLNAVIEAITRLEPRDLLGVCLEIERMAGRERARAPRWSPRTLDVDLLIFGKERLELPDLTVPHPRLGQRRFVLMPLADIAPDLRLPAPYSSTVHDLLEGCEDTTWVRAAFGRLDEACDERVSE